MKRLTAAALAVLFFACSSKKQPGISGTYNAAGGRAKMELLPDSTIKASTKIPGAGSLFNQTGRFSIVNDSIIINWENGKTVRSRLEEKNGSHSFNIGATRYKQED